MAATRFGSPPGPFGWVGTLAEQAELTELGASSASALYYFTDSQGRVDQFDGNAWSTVRSAGAGKVIQEHNTVASVETRIMRALGDNLPTSRVAVGAATPTTADGSDLILFSSFGNSPKKIIASSALAGSGRDFLGWILAVNYGNGTAAASAINDALDAGVAQALATPVQNDADSGLLFIPPECSGLLYSQSTVITSVYAAPLVETGVDATGDSMLAQLSFRP